MKMFGLLSQAKTLIEEVASLSQKTLMK